MNPLAKYGGGLAIALAFFAISVLTLQDYGQTLDEPESVNAALRNGRIVTSLVSGQPIPAWSFHVVPGYYFVVDSLSGGFVWVLSRQLRLLDDVLSFHVFHIVLSALSLFVLYALAFELSGSRRIAIIAAVGLAVLPLFLAHSQNNPKDLPALFAFVLAIHTFARLEPTCRVRDALYAGLALGFALTTHVGAALLVAIYSGWHIAIGRKLPARSYAIVGSVAAVTAFLCWPWLWGAPIERLVWSVRHIHAQLNSEPRQVLYLGTIYNASDVPWHYSLVHLLATTPVAYLACAAYSIAGLRRRGATACANPRAAAILGWLWCTTLVAAEAVAPIHHDGARHLLMILPGLCLLAAVGFDALLERIARPGVAAAVAGLALATVVVQVVRIHPYQSAYLNEIANARIVGNAEDVFEIEYWETSYKEGAEWLKTHAERGAEIYVGFYQVPADHYLGTKSSSLTEETLPLFENPSRPAYVMLMTRKAGYTPEIREVVSRYQPVFTVRRQKGTLLAVYSNRRPR